MVDRLEEGILCPSIRVRRPWTGRLEEGSHA
jgi:hypothetical protein